MFEEKEELLFNSRESQSKLKRFEEKLLSFMEKEAHTRISIIERMHFQTYD